MIMTLDSQKLHGHDLNVYRGPQDMELAEMRKVWDVSEALQSFIQDAKSILWREIIPDQLDEEIKGKLAFQICCCSWTALLNESSLSSLVSREQGIAPSPPQSPPPPIS
jgi:hypothetical protein